MPAMEDRLVSRRQDIAQRPQVILVLPDINDASIPGINMVICITCIHNATPIKNREQHYVIYLFMG
jgi:hypothetical protein